MKKNKNWILLKEFVKTDFKMRYQGSVIGYVWSILKPLLLFSVMYVVFIHFLKFGSDIPHFSIALLLGNVLWNFFSETTNLGLVSIVNRGDLIRKLNFPKEIIVLAVSINAAINLLISFVIVLLFATMSGVQFSWLALLTPLLLIELYAFALGIAFLLATLYVTFRDIAPVWEVFLQLGMYITPIIYPVSLVMQQSRDLATSMLLNPVAQIIQDLRHVLIHPNNMTIWQINGDSLLTFLPYVLPFIVLFIGYSVFKKNANKFAEKV